MLLAIDAGNTNIKLGVYQGPELRAKWRLIPQNLGPAEKYYVHVVATLGTLAEREAEDVGDAVFGRDSEASGLGALGRLVFKTALKVGDYLQSVSAESKSRKLAGADILRKRTP